MTAAGRDADMGFEARVAGLRGRMEASRLLHEMAKPTIAAVQGAAAGAGEAAMTSARRGDAVLAVLPHGTGTVTVVEGGLEIPNDRGTDSALVAHAAAVVRLDLP